MVVVLVAQDYVLLLVILDVLVVVEVVLGLAVETVTVVAEAIVMGVAEAVTECVKVVALVALAVAKDGAKEVVESNPIKEGKWREIKLFL